MVEDETISTPIPTPLPLSPLGGNIDDLPGNHLRYLSLYLGFDHVIGSVAVDGSGLNNDARLTKGNVTSGPLFSKYNLFQINKNNSCKLVGIL